MKEKKEKNTGIKKVFDIIGTVIVYIFIIVSICFVALTVVSKKSPDGASEVFGYQMRVVISPSMEKHEDVDVSEFEIKDIPVYSMVFIETIPDDEKDLYQWYADLEVGDVLTFKYTYATQETITHRIIEIYEKDDKSGFIINLQGDNRGSDSYAGVQVIDTSKTESPNYVIGKVVGTSYILGLITYAVQTPLGMVLIVIVPCLIIIILEIVKIIDTLGEDKRKKIKEEKDKQEEEMERLRRELAELKKQQENKEIHVEGE